MTEQLRKTLYEPQKCLLCGGYYHSDPYSLLCLFKKYMIDSLLTYILKHVLQIYPKSHKNIKSVHPGKMVLL